MKCMMRIPSRRCGRAIVRLGVCATLGVFAATSQAAFITVTNLVTDDQTANPAQITDASLKNAWGVSHSGSSPFWVSDNATGLATLYSVDPITNVTTKAGLVVTIPPSGSGTPTGQVFNSTTAFNSDLFLFVSEDGIVSGWRGALGTTAETLQTADTNNVYKGTTLDTTGGHSYLLSANFKAATIDVLKGDAGAPDLAGKFTDPNLPAGYAPFNTQTLGGKVYVTYALQDAAKHDDVAGAGHGLVNAFDLQGNLLGRIGSTGDLNSPWGLAIAPSSFTDFAGDLLVGNFGDGTINAFSADPANPSFLGQLLGSDGNPIAIDGLWDLIPGNDNSGGSSQNIFFSAGPNSEADGLFGVLQSIVPEPSSLVILLMAIPALCARRRNA